MKVVSQVMTESKWQDDKDIIDCQSCKAAFSVAKRKVDGLCLLLFLSALTYYCLCSIYYSITVGNCGGVFCASCSDNTMQLASSAKPVRVCDNCYQLLLERASK